MTRLYTRFDVVDASDALREEATLASWTQLLDANHHLNGMYAFPEWIAHLHQTGHSPVRLWRLHDDAENLVGAVAVRRGTYDLQFSIKNRVLVAKTLNAAYVLGSLPVLPECHTAFSELIHGVFEDWPDCGCIYFDSLPATSRFWKMIFESRELSGSVYGHVVDGPRPWHLLDLGESFDGYLGTLSSKTRSTLRRKMRKANETPHGKLAMRRFTEPSEVPEFLQRAVEVSRYSWQHRVLGDRVGCDTRACEHMQDIARRGFFRSYLLEFGNTPVAFVIGYQHGGVYHYSELAFREDFSEHSPGTVLLFSLIEDLHGYKRPETLNFGVGDASYKRRFGNRELSDASCLVLRPSLTNQFLTFSHGAFSASVDTMKRVLGRAQVTK